VWPGVSYTVTTVWPTAILSPSLATMSGAIIVHGEGESVVY
jgi:hypothetical protein